MDLRPLCLKCSRRMINVMTGIETAYSINEIQSGDLYQCPLCHYEVIINFVKPYIKETSKDILKS